MFLLQKGAQVADLVNLLFVQTTRPDYAPGRALVLRHRVGRHSRAALAGQEHLFQPLHICTHTCRFVGIAAKDSVMNVWLANKPH